METGSSLITIIGWKIARKGRRDRSRKLGWKWLCFTARKPSQGVIDISCPTSSVFRDGATAPSDSHWVKTLK